MTEEKLFRIIWEIDMPGETPEEAVKQAIEYLAPKEPFRWCYVARDQETGEVSKYEGEDLF